MKDRKRKIKYYLLQYSLKLVPEETSRFGSWHTPQCDFTGHKAQCDVECQLVRHFEQLVSGRVLQPLS